jgi:predicted O-methyltransferase YrrM
MDWDTFDKLWVGVSETADPSMEDSRQGRYIQQAELEFWELVKRVAALNPQKILEIGNACGGTTLFWQELAPSVVSIDLEPVGSESVESLGGASVIERSRFENVEFILGDSHAPDSLQKAKEFAPYDFLFIDGDHSTEGARMDYDMYAPLVRSGGIVAFHDWLYHHVRAAIDSIGTPPDEVLVLSNFGIAIFYV